MISLPLDAWRYLADLLLRSAQPTEDESNTMYDLQIELMKKEDAAPDETPATGFSASK